jgi:hypothetical protein
MVRCKRCGADFTIPQPDGVEPDIYALEEPAEPRARWAPEGTNQEAVFVPARRERRGDQHAPGRAATGSGARRREPDVVQRTWPIRGAIGLVLTLVLLALLAPHGLWLAGCILLVLGSLMILAGYAAGAYGAFHEDLLYGLLYLAVPLYTAYYMITRWEDLWIWLTCSTIGVGLVLLGTELIRWAGTPA